MFVPRQVRARKAPTKKPKPVPAGTNEPSNANALGADPTLTEATVATPPDSDKVLPFRATPAQFLSEPADDQVEEARPAKRIRTSEAEVSQEYLEIVVCGLELVFTDYAYLSDEASQWLEQHERTIDGESGYIHLSVLISHVNLSNIQPPPSQPMLKRAITEHPSEHLILHPSGYYVKRAKPPPEKTTNPLPFEPRTVYIEPHSKTLATSPARVAWHLKNKANLKPKMKPVQAVLTQNCRPGYCFAVMNGGVIMAWNKGPEKWKTLWPENWVVLTYQEWAKRTEEYLDQVKNEKPRFRHSSFNTWEEITDPFSREDGVPISAFHETVRAARRKRKYARKKERKKIKKSEPEQKASPSITGLGRKNQDSAGVADGRSRSLSAVSEDHSDERMNNGRPMDLDTNATESKSAGSHSFVSIM